jgi:hypothetical protein
MRVCVSVALVIQHAKRMCPIILSSVACLALQYFSTLSHKRQDFREKVIKHKMCVLFFSTTFVWNISHFKNNLAGYYNKCTQVFAQCTPYSCLHYLLYTCFGKSVNVCKVRRFCSSSFVLVSARFLRVLTNRLLCSTHLTSTIVYCYLLIVNCFFGLRLYLEHNTLSLSIVKSNDIYMSVFVQSACYLCPGLTKL